MIIISKGISVLAPLSKTEADMAKDYLTPVYVKLLKVVKDEPDSQAKFVAQNGIKSMQMSAICSHLTRRGYVKEGGLFRRKLRRDHPKFCVNLHCGV